jgi:hypothetical protein
VNSPARRTPTDGWSRETRARTVLCDPRDGGCGAQPGEPCRTPSGKVALPGHAPRYRASGAEYGLGCRP